jgi:hypothetical protein
MATVMFMASPTFAAVGIFDFSADVGNVGGTGGVRYVATDEYLILGGGSDIWGNADQFHYAYNEVSGNVRFEMAPAWDIGGTNDWAKIETMIRETTDAGSIHYSTATRRGGFDDPFHTTVDDYVEMQARSVTDAGSWGKGAQWGAGIPQKIAVQRVVSGGYEVVQSLVDRGSGWEVVANQFADLPDNILLGAAVTSHQNQWLVQARIGEAAYTQDPDLVGIIQAGDPLAEACGDLPGLLITAAKMPDGWSFWDDGDNSNGDARADKFAQAEWLIKNNGMVGYTDAYGTVQPPADAMEMGSRVDPVVNLYDSGGYNAFDDDTEKTFPGIDALEINPVEPGDGDDDNQFGVLVTGCIELTEGLHVLGGAFDDGVLIRIGGVEIGRTMSWDEVGQWMFEAPTTGIYEFEAVGYEEGGGAYLELYEWLPDGSMILIGAEGGSPVYVPEPATIALLGFGGLSLLRIRRKR